MWLFITSLAHSTKRYFTSRSPWCGETENFTDATSFRLCRFRTNLYSCNDNSPQHRTLCLLIGRMCRVRFFLLQGCPQTRFDAGGRSADCSRSMVQRKDHLMQLPLIFPKPGISHGSPYVNKPYVSKTGYMRLEAITYSVYTTRGKISKRGIFVPRKVKS